MTRTHHPALDVAFAEYLAAGRPLPLEVSRSCYDADVRSWEVLYTSIPWNGSSGCSDPIAEFTSWREAQDWAVLEARKSTSLGDSRRTLGPPTREQSRHQAAWDAYTAGTGPHPHELERAWLLDDLDRSTTRARP